jgi:hypothetical protein
MTLLAERIKDYFLEVLSWFKNPELIRPPDDEYTEVPESPKAESTPKAEKFPKTLSDLLDNIEATFDTYKLKLSPNSWLSRDECIGLRKLGAHIPTEGIVHDRDSVHAYKQEKTLIDTKQKPSLFLISTGNNTNRNGALKYMFGIKHKKLPWQIKKVDGTPYAFGMAHKYEKELFWIHGWIVITPDNNIVLCDELRHEPVRLPDGKGYVRKKFGIPELAEGLATGEFAKDEMVKAAFVFSFNYWVKRKDRWSVAVSHKGERLTFGVPKEATKKYFAGRDKSAKTATGRTKKIVHYVQEHNRVINGKATVVKEHVRGLSVFDWNGYKCVVTAPEFHFAASIEFDITPTVEGDDVDQFPKDYIGMSKLGHLLAQREDLDSLKRHAA